MAKQTHTHSSAAAWTIEDIYNALMFDIEPELMTDIIPELDAMYADETEEEKQERSKRYAAAFKEFFKRFEGMMGIWKDELKSFKKNILTQVKAKADSEDSKILGEIESSFDDA